MKITIDIPDNVASRVVDGFAYDHQYQDKITVQSLQGEQSVEETKNNPETKEEFLKRRLIEYIKSCVRTGETRKREEIAKEAEEELSF